ncbi:Uncharacterised protein [Acinetobacter baumannii]|nr:Uncharacterised protein [Acinetobacter baumannii]
MAAQPLAGQQVARDTAHAERHQKKADGAAAEADFTAEIFSRVSIDGEHGGKDQHAGDDIQPQRPAAQDHQLFAITEALNGDVGQPHQQSRRREEIDPRTEPERGFIAELPGDPLCQRYPQHHAHAGADERIGGCFGGLMRRIKRRGRHHGQRKIDRMKQRRHNAQQHEHGEAVRLSGQRAGRREHGQRDQ